MVQLLGTSRHICVVADGLFLEVAVEIVTTIAQMGNDIANHKELMAAMDK